ncbi:MAG: 23S rRNA (guanosine(2251)-2'-O)-methyltransferase RlmB [Chitinophagaceae bacterium]|nr:23S rRNA (guanosine(2251)-2'-O)-methyltransferase RlmB [Chitinophagaceae bacterium]
MKKSSLIIGRQPLIEALETGKAIDKIFMFRNINGENVHRIRELAKSHQIPVQMVPVEKLNSFTRANHQGVVALTAAVQYTGLQQMIDYILAKGEPPLLLMLDGVTDIRNIGAIARTAVCCGVHGIIIPSKGVGALNEEAIKSSAGALELLHLSRVNSLAHAIDTLHLNGIKVIASEMKAAQKVFDMDFSVPCCVILGNEEKGIQHFLSKAADEHFTIPIAGDFNSYNVSVAAGIILYEAMKQRMMGNLKM